MIYNIIRQGLVQKIKLQRLAKYYGLQMGFWKILKYSPLKVVKYFY